MGKTPLQIQIPKATTSKMYDIELFMIDWTNKWDLMSVAEKEIAMNELGKELER